MTANAQQLESLLADYAALLNNPALPQEEQVAISQEQRFLTKILHDILWQQLTDDQKQTKRKARVALLNMQSSQEGSSVEFVYEKYTTELYDLIQVTLCAVADVATTNGVVLRLKAFLITEKSFIDADSSFAKRRHMDYYLWQNFFIANASQLESIHINASNLMACFHSMYKNWSNRPYKEI